MLLSPCTNGLLLPERQRGDLRSLGMPHRVSCGLSSMLNLI